MVKLHPYPSYQPVTLHLACLLLPVMPLFLPLKLKFYIWYEVESFTPELAFDKR